MASQNLGFQNQENPEKSSEGVCMISAGLAGNDAKTLQESGKIPQNPRTKEHFLQECGSRARYSCKTISTWKQEESHIVME